MGKYEIKRKYIIEYLEYLLVLFVILTNSTLFSHSTNSESFNSVAKVVPIVTVFLLIFLQLGFEKEKYIESIKGIELPLLVTLWFTVYYLLTKADMSTEICLDYVIKMLIFFGTVSIYFRIKKIKCEILDIWYKFADIIFIISITSLILYIALLLNPDVVRTGLSESRWSGTATRLGSVFGVVNFSSGSVFKVGSISFIKNCGICPEPPMFYSLLCIGLFVELFLRKNRVSLLRAVIVSLCIITTGGTNGIIIMIMGWGLLALTYITKVSKVLPIILVLVLALVCGGLILDKKKQGRGSFDIHINDYKVTMDCALDNPILGVGYRNTDGVMEYMSEVRRNQGSGLSNSVGPVYAHLGLIGGSLFLLAFGVGLLQYFNQNRKKVAYFTVGLFAIYALVAIQYNYMLILMIAFLYSLIDVRIGRNIIICLWGVDNSTLYTSEHVEAPLSWKKLAILVAVILVGFVTFMTSDKVYNLGYSYFIRHNLYLIQSVCMMPVYFMAILSAIFVLRYEYEISEYGERLKITTICIVATFLAVVVYESCFPNAYIGVETILKRQNIYNDFSVGVMLYLLFDVILYSFNSISVRIYRVIAHNTCLKKVALQVALAIVASVTFASSLVIVGTKNKRLSVPLEDIENPSELMHEASFEFIFERPHYNANKLLCSINIYSIDNLPLETKYIFGGDLDDEGRAIFDMVYVNTSNNVNVYYEIVPEDGVVFSVKASSKYNELQELRVSKYNYLNKVISIAYYNGDGTPRVLAGGYSIIQYDYDKQGRVIAIRYYNALGEPIMFRGEYFEVKYERDGRGNALREAYFDTQGVYKTFKQGYSIIERDYDSADQVISTRYYDGNGEPVIYSNLYFEERNEYDDQLRIKSSYWDVNGKLSYCRDKYSISSMKYDENRRVTEIKYYDPYEKLTKSSLGYATVRYEYNAAGKIISEKYYDENDHLVNQKDGYAVILRDFDDDNRLLGEAYQDENENPIGYEVRREYDKNGNLSRISYYSVNPETGDNELSMYKGEYAYIDYYYDSNNRRIREESFNTEGELTANGSNYAVLQNEYDQATGRKKRVTYYDENRSPVYLNGLYCAVTYGYDEKGNVSEESYWGFDDKPAVVEQGYHRVDKLYDDNNNVIETLFYGVNDRLMITNNGYAGIIFEYDANNRCTLEKYLDRDKENSVLKSGIAQKHIEYDENGNNIREYYTDNANKTAVLWDDYSEVISMYNDDNRVIRKEYYKAGEKTLIGKGYFAIAYEYDDRGLLTRTTYLDLSDEKIVMADGYSSELCEYDEKKQVTSRKYLDNNDNTAVLPRGFSELRYEYDELGRCIRMEYYDKHGKKVALGNGVFAEEYKYDKIGYGFCEADYYGIDNRPILVGDEYSIIRRYYNNKKKVFKDEYCNDEGNLVNRKSGQAYYEQVWDDRGNVIQISYFDADGNPVNINGQYFLEARAYDPDNNLKNKMYYTVDGEEYTPE